MRLGRPRLSPWLVLLAAAAACQGCRPADAASAPTAPVAEEGVYDAEANKDPDKRARTVGRGLARLQLGMTRRDVEAILGPPDRGSVPRVHLSETSPKT